MITRLIIGDCRDVLKTLPDESVHCVVTSPPYFGLRDYGVVGQIGLEPTPEAFIAEMVAVFREVRRVLRQDGTCWINIGDSYSGAPRGNAPGDMGKSGLTNPWRQDGMLRGGVDKSQIGAKPKDLLMIPARLALALQADGWWLRSDIIWAKPNPMPESVTDRPTSAHEHVFLLTRYSRYFYDAEAVKEAAANSVIARAKYDVGGTKIDASRNDAGRGSQRGFADYAEGRNLRNVWTIPSAPFSEWTQSAEIVPVPVSEVLAHGAPNNGAGGDMARITSPDCALHAGHPDRVPTGFYDGLQADQLSRMRGIGIDRVPGTHPGSDTIARTPVHSLPDLPMPDYSGHEDARTATPNSTEIRKTAHDPRSSAHAISCEGIAGGTERNPRSQPAIASMPHGIGASNTGAGNSVSSSEQQTVAGTVHTSTSGNSVSCCCGYYRKVVTKTSHFATFPPALIEPCIKAGCPAGGTVLDPFGGAGTTGLVADRLGRNAILIELNADYAAMGRRRVEDDSPLFAQVTP